MNKKGVEIVFHKIQEYQVGQKMIPLKCLTNKIKYIIKPYCFKQRDLFSKLIVWYVPVEYKQANKLSISQIYNERRQNIIFTCISVL